MSVIRWEEPADSQYGRWKRTTEMLTDKPGEWALVAEGLSYNTAYYSVKRSLRKYGCEVKVAKVNEQGHSVWARVVDSEETKV